MKEFDLQIVTPDGMLFDGKAEKIILRTSEGDVGILPGHINYVAALSIGVARVFTGGNEIRQMGYKDINDFLNEFAEKNNVTEKFTVSVIVGSEGGFSDREAQCAKDAGLTLTGLGTRILRTESAAPFVLASLVCRFELT